MHNCPKCGKPTEGTFSEGGIRWAICEDCMDEVDHRVIESRPSVLFVGDCPRCGGRGSVRNDGFVWVACPACSGNRN